MTSEQMVRLAASALDSKKGQNIRAIGIGKVSVLTDYFVIAGGNSNTHVRALADEVEFVLARQGIRPDRIEGGDSESWLLLDYGGVIVHVFQEQVRDFYDLERLWQDGEEYPLDDILTPD